MDENSSITYSNVNNITYQGTQAQGGTFIYNNVANIQKEAVELHNSYSSSSSSRGINAGATIGYGHKIQTTGNGGSISASQSNQNTVETIYANGNFKNVNEVHNNTGSMVLNGFNQEGGKVTGNIGKVEVISRQNTSTTTGSSSGMSLGISANGVPSSVNINGSRTNGDRAFVDNQSTFIIGEGSNLHVGTLENTGAVVGKQGNSTFKIDSYIGKDIQNHDTMKTTGGSLGISTGKPKITNVGFNQDSRDKQGITRNTVVGDVEIAGAEGSPINSDLGKANEVTRDTHSSTNINVESQTIEYLTNPAKLKEDIGKAKKEIADVKKAIKESIHDRGDDNRNFFGQLREVRLNETVNNIAGKRLNEADKSEDVVAAWKDAYKDLGYNLDVRYTTGEDTPEMKNKAGTAYISKDGVHTIIININAKENSTKAGLIGTLAEEASHIVNGVAGRQIVTGTDEKGLESTGRAANDYFQEEYKRSSQNMTYTSDGKIDTSKLGTNVGNLVRTKEKDLEKLKNVTETVADYDLERVCDNINGYRICQVTNLISTNDNTKKTAARFLIESAVAGERIVNVIFSTKPTQFVEDPENPENSVLNINEKEAVKTIVKNIETGKISKEDTPKEIEWGHDWIHVAEFMKGVKYGVADYVTHWYVDENGKLQQSGVKIEDIPVGVNGKTVTLKEYEQMLKNDKSKLEKGKGELLKEMFDYCQNEMVCELSSGKTTKEEFNKMMEIRSKIEKINYTQDEIKQLYTNCSINNNCPRVVTNLNQVLEQEELKRQFQENIVVKLEQIENNEKELIRIKNELRKKCENNICALRKELRTVGTGNKSKEKAQKEANDKSFSVYGDYNNISNKNNVPNKINSLDEITENLLRIQGGFKNIRIDYGDGK